MTGQILRRLNGIKLLDRAKEPQRMPNRRREDYPQLLLQFVHVDASP
jgi:hypothetical protein